MFKYKIIYLTVLAEFKTRRATKEIYEKRYMIYNERIYYSMLDSEVAYQSEILLDLAKKIRFTHDKSHTVKAIEKIKKL